jgi:hypothetical protein
VNAYLEVGGGEVASELAGIVHQRHGAHITSPEGVKDLELMHGEDEWLDKVNTVPSPLI